MAILVTGGAGYIGSHTCVELLNAGYEIIVVDNLANSKAQVVQRVGEIAGKKVQFHQVDLLNRPALEQIFTDNEIDAVIHFAGLKAVGESVQHPLMYYQNNIEGSIVLFDVMQAHHVHRLVFSSSATVYGASEEVPLAETLPLSPVNPYGWTKMMIEQILRDVAASDDAWSVALLRYFNPVGAHPSGRIGEDPSGVPNNLVPYITQVAVGKLPELKVFGDDYNTPDGTGVRDYIHVMDLAHGHLKALEKTLETQGVEIYNLGTGVGYSVLDVVRAVEEVSGVKVPYKIVNRRPGDVAVSYADPAKAKRELGWIAVRNLHEMCADAWRWQVSNPDGYGNRA